MEHERTALKRSFRNPSIKPPSTAGSRKNDCVRPFVWLVRNLVALLPVVRHVELRHGGLHRGLASGDPMLDAAVRVGLAIAEVLKEARAVLFA